MTPQHLSSVRDFLAYIGVRPERLQRLEPGEREAVRRLIPSSWVLADTFDAVTQHSPELNLSDPGLCYALEHDPALELDSGGRFVYRELSPTLEVEGAALVECPTCYGTEFVTERGSSPWYAKTRKADPESYALLYEHLDVSARFCPACVCGLQAAA